jgi:hypothetical protein
MPAPRRRATPPTVTSVPAVAAKPQAVVPAVPQRPFSGIRNVKFVAERPAAFGVARKIEAPAFKAGGTMLVYVEPTNYGWTRTAAGAQFHITFDIEFRLPDGVILGGKRGMFVLENEVPAVREDLFVTLAVTVPQLPPGSYVLGVGARVNPRGPRAEVSLPFTLMASSAAAPPSSGGTREEEPSSSGPQQSSGREKLH